MIMRDGAILHSDNDVSVARMKKGWGEKNDDLFSYKEKVIK
jgi:hypothetical protein